MGVSLTGMDFGGKRGLQISDELGHKIWWNLHSRICGCEFLG